MDYSYIMFSGHTFPSGVTAMLVRCISTGDTGSCLCCNFAQAASWFLPHELGSLPPMYISQGSTFNSIQNILFWYSSIGITFSTPVKQNYEQNRQSKQSRCTSSSFNRQYSKGTRDPHGFMGPFSVKNKYIWNAYVLRIPPLSPIWKKNQDIIQFAQLLIFQTNIWLSSYVSYEWTQLRPCPKVYPYQVGWRS